MCRALCVGAGRLPTNSTLTEAQASQDGDASYSLTVSFPVNHPHPSLELYFTVFITINYYCLHLNFIQTQSHCM